MFLEEELGGHGKDHRVIQKVLPLEHIFNVDDRITPISESVGFGRFGIIGTITDIKYDKRKQINWLHILWDDGKSDRHVAGAKTLKIVEQNLPLEQCDTLTYSVVSEGLQLPQKVAEEYTPSNLSKLIQMPKPSCDRTGEISQSTQILVTTHQDAESLTSIPLDSHVQEPARQEQEQDLITKTQPYGLKPLDVFARGNQASLLLKTLKDLSIEDFEQCLEDCEWQDIAGTVRNSYRQNGLAHRINETGYLSLPTPNASSKANSRAAGQTRCEVWFRQNGLLRDSQCLSPQIMALLLGFPMDWTQCLWELKDVLGEESVVDICLEEPLSLLVQPSLLDELNISTIIEEINLDTFSSERSPKPSKYVDVDAKFDSSSKKYPLEREFKIGDRVRFGLHKGEIFDTDYRVNPEWFYVAWDGQENKLVAPYHISDLEHETTVNICSEKYPLERSDRSENFDVLGDELIDRLARLETERNQIRSTGPVAICGVWIEYGKVAKRKFRQAYYRSTKAIFPAKRQSSFAKSESGLVKRSYIGEENSKEVKAAGEAIARRNRLMAIAKEIKQIEEKLIE